MKTDTTHRVVGALEYIVCLGLLILGIKAGWNGEYARGAFLVALSVSAELSGDWHRAKVDGRE